MVGFCFACIPHHEKLLNPLEKVTGTIYNVFMQDDTKDLKTGEKPEEEVSMDLDHEAIDDQIVEMFGGKK